MFRGDNYNISVALWALTIMSLHFEFSLEFPDMVMKMKLEVKQSVETLMMVSIVLQSGGGIGVGIIPTSNEQ